MPRLGDGKDYEVVEIPQDKIKAVIKLLGCDERTATQVVATAMDSVVYNNRPDLAPCGYYRKKAMRRRTAAKPKIKMCKTCKLKKDCVFLKGAIRDGRGDTDCCGFWQ